jgi:hypothetical protein
MGDMDSPRYLERAQRRAALRGVRLTMADACRLYDLRVAVDPLEVRARCVRAGFQMVRRHSYVRGVARGFLTHRRAS